MQERLGIVWAVTAIVAGGILSTLLTSPTIAFASVSSFMVAELADLLVFTLMRKRGFLRAAILSSLIGLLLDSLIFVYLAFGQLDHLAGQVLGKTWAVLLILPLLLEWRRRQAASVQG